MSLSIISSAAWWCCNCSKLSDGSMLGFWTCCACTHLNNEALSSERCGNCGHTKCPYCVVSKNSVKTEDGISNPTEDRSDQEYNATIAPTDQPQQPIQIGSPRRPSSANSAYSLGLELTQTCGNCGHKRCTLCKASVACYWAKDDIDNSTEDRSGHQYNASMAPIDQPEQPVHIGSIRGLSPADSVYSSSAELTQLIDGLLLTTKNF